MSILKTKRDLISALPLKHLKDIPPSTELPVNFAKIHPPRFECGFRVRWVDVGEEADWGIVIGKFYNYEPRLRCWIWCYIICLNPDSKSAAWCQFDTAWEEDLERYQDEKAIYFDR
ncbi:MULTISPECIES: hypothetical protein [unclassified Microcoleus]|uniref:hypothetical protein n=1 Tax=unclassified Microcoleus TaxID=2642155 RepID=UPI001DA4D61F|nr:MULTISPECIES: hypothetical protein [unclassified Microcoleus]MCC3406774.1 hypothetical protein [Microcoleus sp. PH2017_10_PVI_O_A]MCC3415148.1 hypothetical protein [Microcoleus sp. PH2017_02_FOX_O_A]MCC3460909.1 hypothetical protein [Microcoleus sp. PH2017_11_PCY_U_A]MCC3479431.1 hypothetical protein [Microcoleus sp. PH2017_12_PCY_D_A]MCC3519343.1 hypothetical protein [Microcoleus sp. PH2017_18_LLB_O_A]